MKEVMKEIVSSYLIPAAMTLLTALAGYLGVQIKKAV